MSRAILLFWLWASCLRSSSSLLEILIGKTLFLASNLIFNLQELFFCRLDNKVYFFPHFGADSRYSSFQLFIHELPLYVSRAVEGCLLRSLELR